ALRLFAQPLVDQASWLIPLAVIGALVAVFRDRLRYPLSDKHGALILWGLWLITEVVFFSVANLFHAYYLVMLAPPLAALVGIGVMALWQTYRDRAWIGTGLTVLALGLTAAFQVIVLRQYPDQRGILIPLIVVGTLMGVGALVLTRRINRIPPAALGLGLAALLIAPLAWSAITALDLYPNFNLPNAGPPTADEQGANQRAVGPPPGGTTGPEARAQMLIDYLAPRTDDTFYLVATLNARDASPL
ncbi:MAG: hypothetical protein HY260_11665, partial [Chloroflexi bacterium]|nr:hypothetical protein [Chloroflexota bacterium]